ncbi:MAG: SUMF1/EgtB/PvdO family nonheme iron enzyme, partial [Saprospiraceae bacterium]
VRYEYHDEDLWVNSRAAGERDFPVLAMDWAEGVTLGEYVRPCCARDDRAALEKLIAEFNWFAFWLLSQPFAHGDLKPDNIVVRPDGKPVLLDYDGMYVPAMKGQPARELGSPLYRHPARTVDAFDKRIDDFALLVLLLELRLLAANPVRHEGRGGSESLYFRADELRTQDWRTGLPEAHDSRHLLRCFDAALEGTPVDLATLLFAVLRGDALLPLPPVEKPRVAILQPRFEWEPEMVFVEGGTFWMGSEDDDPDAYVDEKPAHRVTLHDFYIGKYEVTQAQWRAVMGSDPRELYNKGCDECPVEGISWNEVQEFLKELNTLTGKTYRLPTEAEWEYAARCGKNSLPVGEGRGGAGYRYSGSNNLDEMGWYSANAKQGNTFGSQKTTRPVGTKKPNELGLYDMSGNVWEWCADDWHSDYNGAPTDGRAWVDSPRGSGRVYRGGSWSGSARNCRVSYRSNDTPVHRRSRLGFRLASSPQ